MSAEPANHHGNRDDSGSGWNGNGLFCDEAALIENLFRRRDDWRIVLLSLPTRVVVRDPFLDFDRQSESSHERRFGRSERLGRRPMRRQVGCDLLSNRWLLRRRRGGRFCRFGCTSLHHALQLSHWVAEFCQRGVHALLQFGLLALRGGHAAGLS